MIGESSAIKSWFYNSSALRGWTPGRSWNTWRPRLLSLPLAKGDYPRKTNSQPIMKTRMIKVNLLVLRVVKPVDKGDIKIDTENINKMDLPGACRREEKGPVKPNPHLLQDLGGMVWCLFCLSSIMPAHSGSR